MITAVACLGPNPFLDDIASESTDSDTNGDGDGDGDGDSGDGDGDPGDGDGDGPDCGNGVQDGDETDVDCGGSCGPCGPGGACLYPEDCESMVCDTNVCTEPACDDEVRNGDEIDVDCGGSSCAFCAHSPYVDEFDDFEGSDALAPSVALFDDGVFAIMYPALGLFEYRIRWFDELATPMGPGELMTDALFDTFIVTPTLVATPDLADHKVYAVLSGRDMNSTNSDVFAIERGQATPASHLPIYQGSSIVSGADMVLDGDVATFAYLEAGQIKLWHYNYATNTAVDSPILANPDHAQRPAKAPTLARRNGVTVVAWVACEAMMNTQCDLVLRSFDLGWIQGAPVALGLDPVLYREPQLAIAADDRVGLTFSSGPANAMQAWAVWLDAELAIEGQPWVLQDPIAPTLTSISDVVALEDGTFAFAWADTTDSSVTIRRYAGPDTPLIPELDTEAPWPSTIDPSWVRMSVAGNKVAVAWCATLDGVFQIQGQILSY